eukprot:2756093-Rhodomonas_salina.1
MEPNVTFDILVIAGGGAGSIAGGGGGGAGGLFHVQEVQLPMGNYTVRVGNGGVYPYIDNSFATKCPSLAGAIWSPNGDDSWVELPDGKTIRTIGGGGSPPGSCSHTRIAGVRAATGGSGGGASNPHASNGQAFTLQGGLPAVITDDMCGGLVVPCSNFMHGHEGGRTSHSKHSTTCRSAGGGGGGAGGQAPGNLGNTPSASWGSTNQDRRGGPGMMVNITGHGYWWAGGGGGSEQGYNGGRQSAGGIGGGGDSGSQSPPGSWGRESWSDEERLINGPYVSNAVIDGQGSWGACGGVNYGTYTGKRGSDAHPNTGGGGGGSGASNAWVGGSGASGIVVIRINTCPNDMIRENGECKCTPGYELTTSGSCALCQSKTYCP